VSFVVVELSDPDALAGHRHAAEEIGIEVEAVTDRDRQSRDADRDWGRIEREADERVRLAHFLLLSVGSASCRACLFARSKLRRSIGVIACSRPAAIATRQSFSLSKAFLSVSAAIAR
jgi:hypothetical protein